MHHLLTIGFGLLAVLAVILLALAFVLLRRDRVRRERAAADTRREKEWLRVTLLGIGDGVIATDERGRVRFLNPVARELTGWPEEEAIGLPVGDIFRIVNEQTRQTVANPLERVLKEGVVVGLANHTVLIGRDGVERPIDDSGGPIRSGDGRVIGAVLVFRDVSERRRAEAALAERVRLAEYGADVGAALTQSTDLPDMLRRCTDATVRRFDAAFARIWTVNAAGDVLELQASSGLYTHLDGPHGRVPVGQLKIGLIAQERKPHLTNAVVGDPRVGDQEWARREGMIAFAGYPLVVEDRLVGVVALFARRPLRDAALQALASVADELAVGIERKRAERSMREEKRIAETLVRISGRLAQEHDLQRLVQTTTDEATQLTGARFGAFFYNVLNAEGESYTLYTLSGAPREAFAQFPMPRNTAIFNPTFRGEGALRIADVTQDPRYGHNPPYQGMPEGHLPVRSYLSAPVVSRSGEVLGGLFFGHPDAGVFDERAEQLVVGIAAQAAVAIDNARLYEQLRRRVEELAEADRRKDNFLAMLGHELRNPLAPIRNAVAILERSDDGGERGQALQMIGRQMTHLTRLIDELLDASRIANGKIQLRRERLDLAALVRVADEDRRADLEAAGLVLETDAPDGPIWVDGDAVRLTQVVGNLLHNAAKFTDAGGRVVVRAAADAGAGRAVVTVRDTGVGIEPGMIRRLFEPFAQADGSLDRSGGGLGLGLALSKGLIELHGGGIRASSAGLGKGSEFTFWLPSAGEPEAGAPAPKPPPARTKGRKILIIEDNRDAADSLRLLLQLAGGHEVAVAYTGTDGVTTARSFAPEVVLCDLGLPGLSGFEVARALRAEPATASAFLIAVSGYGQEEDRRQALAAGFDEAVVKPVAPVDLIRLAERGRRPT